MNETNETKWLRTIGVDLHKCSMTIAVLDELGQQFDEKEIPTKCRNQIRDFFSSYGLQAQVAVESVGFYHWFWNLVRPLVGKMILANPTALAPFRGRKAKTDRKDARLIAELLFQGRLPPAFVPSESIRTLRELLRHRHSLARALATERRHLGWIGLKNNLTGPTSWTSDRAQKWLLAQEDKLSPAHRFAARQRLDHIVRLQRDVLDAEGLVAPNSPCAPPPLRPARPPPRAPGPAPAGRARHRLAHRHDHPRRDRGTHPLRSSRSVECLRRTRAARLAIGSERSPRPHLQGRPARLALGVATSRLGRHPSQRAHPRQVGALEQTSGLPARRIGHRPPTLDLRLERGPPRRTLSLARSTRARRGSGPLELRDLTHWSVRSEMSAYGIQEPNPKEGHCAR